MPAGYTQINEGTGKKIGSWQRTDESSNTIEEQKVVISLPFLATYGLAVTTAVSTATANSHLLQVMAGANLRVGISQIKITQLAAAGAATQMVLQVLRLTTAGTGGTSFTPRAMDPVDSASGATAMTLPSSKGTESNIVWTETCNMWAAVPSAGSVSPTFSIDFVDLFGKPLAIAAGTSNGVALKNITAVASGTVHISVDLVELGWS